MTKIRCRELCASCGHRYSSHYEEPVDCFCCDYPAQYCQRTYFACSKCDCEFGYVTKSEYEFWTQK